MRRQRGFTLLEILIAMSILVFGGVGILSLFAAAVSLQYDAVVSERQAAILTDIVAEAQHEFDAYRPEEGRPVPPAIERKPAPRFPRDFEYEVEYEKSAHFPPSEGVIATVTVYYRGAPLEPMERVLQKTVFSQEEIERSISYEQDKRADEEAERRKAEEERR